MLFLVSMGALLRSTSLVSHELRELGAIQNVAAVFCAVNSYQKAACFMEKFDLHEL
jgi:hypothetical protein